MNSNELRLAFLEHFRERGHVVIPSASLLPENDSTTLFTGSGMQSLVPYLLGEKHPLGARLTNSQKCFRTVDIEEVGDDRHYTFFEMLGNWSLGDYFKEEQLTWIFDFLIQKVGLNPNNLYVTVFRGNEKLNIPRDDESVRIWQRLFKTQGMEAVAVDYPEKQGMGDGRIFYYDEAKNWWSRSGVPEAMPEGEPGGPDSEIFWDFGADLKIHETSPYAKQPCHVNCDCGRFLEIGNSVFIEYRRAGAAFERLKQKNVDFGGGPERILAAIANKPDTFLQDFFEEARLILEGKTGKAYAQHKKPFQVILDHLRAAVFLIADGSLPSNKDRGYFVRRLLRRAIRFGKELGVLENFCKEVGVTFLEFYGKTYSELISRKTEILEAIEKEENQFNKTLQVGLKKLDQAMQKDQKDLGSLVFDLYQTNGFPFELSLEELKNRGVKFNPEQLKAFFEEELKKHQGLSRTASAGRFKGGPADATFQTTRLHTAAHLMLAGLRKVLGKEVHQRGSNITADRLRFDFSYPQKLTEEQKKAVEDFVNEAIRKEQEVTVSEMTPEAAKQSGAEGVFGHKYGAKVKVYTIKDCSKEICGGPHVLNTRELGYFKVIKEESSSAGVRRIKATLTDH